MDALAAPHEAAFLDRLDATFRGFGAPGLPPRLREAVRLTPRHRFVHRFREGPDGPLRDLAADPAGLLPVVYRGQPLTAVDAAGAALPSTNSEAAYVLQLVAWLGIEPGARVLEIGSGSGWLLAVMSHLAGPEGRAVGVEIIPELAAQSRADLAALGRRNADVLAADGTAAAIPGGPFDRAIVTAATWDVPRGLFGAVAEGGRLLVPLRLPADAGCEVVLLRRAGAGFVAERSTPGRFVPLVGAGQTVTAPRLSLDAPPFPEGIGPGPSLSHPFWLGALVRDGAGPAAMAFRHHLALTEPGFAVFAPEAGAGTGPHATDFGLVDADGRSAALCRAGRLLGFGTQAAAARLAAAYRRWADLGMPGPAAYALRVMPADAPTPAGTCIEPRGDSVLIRTLDPDAGAWRSLLDGAAP